MSALLFLMLIVSLEANILHLGYFMWSKTPSVAHKCKCCIVSLLKKIMATHYNPQYDLLVASVSEPKCHLS